MAEQQESGSLGNGVDQGLVNHQLKLHKKGKPTLIFLKPLSFWFLLKQQNELP